MACYSCLLHSVCKPVIETAAALLTIFIVSLVVRDQNRPLPQRPLHPSEEALRNNLEQVKLLFDYTKFHITVYGTIAALLLTASTTPRKFTPSSA
jgi:hypothetical protein